jgi:hypothetical protein
MFCRCRDDPAAANAAISLRTLRWTFPAKRASVVVTDSEPGRLAPLPRQRRVASAGFGWWRRHVAPARLRGVLACPSGNVGEPPRRSAMAQRPGALDKKLPPRRGVFFALENYRYALMLRRPRQRGPDSIIGDLGGVAGQIKLTESHEIGGGWRSPSRIVL